MADGCAQLAGDGLRGGGFDPHILDGRVSRLLVERVVTDAEKQVRVGVLDDSESRN